MVTKNAKIESTFLGFEDHGLFTFLLSLDYGGSHQGFGHYRLDKWDDKKEDCVGTAYGSEAIMRLLNVVGVNSWENLKGKYVRVRLSDYSWNSTIDAIGNIIHDKWLSLSELAEEFEKELV